MKNDKVLVLFKKRLEDNINALNRKEDPTEAYMRWVVGMETYDRSQVRDLMVYQHTQHHMKQQGIDLRGIPNDQVMDVVYKHLLTLERSGYIDVITQIYGRKRSEQERKRLSENVSYRDIKLEVIRSISERLSQWWKAWQVLGHPDPPINESIRAYISWVETMTYVPISPDEWDDHHRQCTYDYVDEYLTPIIPEMSKPVYEIMASHMTTIRTMK